MVIGVGGIGKTRLLSEAWRRAEIEPSAITVRCSQQGLMPLDPIARLADRLGCGEAVDLLQDASIDDDTSRSDVQRRTAVVARVAREILRAASDRRGVLVVDDLHWSSATAQPYFEMLIEEIEQAPSDAPVLLVLSTRPVPHDHPVRSLLSRVERLPYTTKLAVEGMSPEEEATLVRSMAEQASPTLLSLIHRSARGNPLRARAVLEIARERGLDRLAAVPDPRMLGQVELPIDVDDPITSWLMGLDDTVTGALGACAVLDEEFTVADAAFLWRLPARSVERLLDRGIRMGLLGGDGRTLWFAHPHYREVLAEMLGVVERMGVHARSAELLSARRPASVRDDIAIGVHLLAAGSASLPGRAASFSRAGAGSMRIASWSEAARFFEAAESQAAADGNPVPSGLHLSAGRAHYLNHDYRAAVRHLRIALGESRALGDESAECTALVHLMWCGVSADSASLRRPSDSHDVAIFLETARDKRLRSRALEVLAESQIAAGHLEAGAATARDALEMAEASQDGRAIAFARFAIGFAHLSGAEIDLAIDELTQADRAAVDTGDWYMQSGIKARLAFALLARGDIEVSDRVADESIAIARQQAEYTAQALSGIVQVAIAACRGDYRNAEEQLAAAVQSTERSGHNVGVLFLAPLTTFIALRQDLAADAHSAHERWPELPIGVAASLDDAIGVEVDRSPRHPDLRLPNTPTLVGAANLVAQVEAALRRRDLDTLREAVPRLRRLDDLGLIIPPGYPVLIPRLTADAEAAIGEDEQSAASYGRAVAISRSGELYPELAYALLGSAVGESDRRGGSRDVARQSAIEALSLAERLGLTDIGDRASRLLRQTIDSPAAIEARGGDWRVILSSDVQGSTAISNDYGDPVYHEVVSLHHNLVQSICKANGGTWFSDGGDGLMIWFADTDSAVRSAIEIQDAVADERADHLAIKIGLAGGEPLFRDDRPFGLVVNRAARMEAAAAGGEITLDEYVAAHVSGAWPVEDRGVVDLKGIGPHRITALRYRDIRPGIDR